MVSFYFTAKEKRWVVFRREEDPTSIPGNFQTSTNGLFHGFICMYESLHLIICIDLVTISCLINVVVVEWICWLNGQRKRAPTPEVRSTPL